MENMRGPKDLVVIPLFVVIGGVGQPAAQRPIGYPSSSDGHILYDDRRQFFLGIVLRMIEHSGAVWEMNAA